MVCRVRVHGWQLFPLLSHLQTLGGAGPTPDAGLLGVNVWKGYVESCPVWVNRKSITVWSLLLLALGVLPLNSWKPPLPQPKNTCTSLSELMAFTGVAAGPLPDIQHPPPWPPQFGAPW